MLFVMLRFVFMACVLSVSMSVNAQETESPVEVDEASPEQVAETSESEAESEPDPDAAEARMRFELGSILYTQGRFAEALAEFSRSFELSGEPRLLHNMYLCERDAGHSTAAAEYLRHYLLDSGEAVENRALLESRLETLVESAAREEEDRQQLDAPVLIQRPPSRVLPIILFATGGAALATAGGLALHVSGLQNNLEQACYGVRCPEHHNDDREALGRRAITVDILWASGLVMSLTGILAWVLAKPTLEESPVAV